MPTFAQAAKLALTVGCLAALAACSVQTDPVTNITATSATLHGHGVCDSGQSCTAWAEFRQQGTSTWSSTATKSYRAGSYSHSVNVTGLSSHTTYQFRACATQADLGGAIVCSSVSTFATSGTGLSWPASYTDGPLGQTNVLPNTHNGVLLGDWGGIQGQTSLQNRQFVQQRIADMGRPFDLIGDQCPGNCVPGAANKDVSSTNLFETWASSLGAVPVMTWDPDGTLRQIPSGSEDSEIVNTANRFKAFGHRIMVRLFHEFNGPWEAPIYPCGHNRTSNGGPAEFVAAWRHVVNVFKAQGARNVGFWWTPSEGQDRQCANLSYPGDAYVDWVGSDSFNWGTGFNVPCISGWGEFNGLFNYSPTASCNVTSTYSRYGGRKPVVVGETGSKFDPSNPNSKRNWFENLVTVAAPTMPNLHGIQFFDQDVVPAEGNDWRVNTDQTLTSSSVGPADANTYQGFLDLSHARAFNSGVAP